MLQKMLKRMPHDRSMLRMIGLAFLVILLVAFNFVLCSRVIAPQKTASLLFSLVVPVLTIVFVVACEFVRKRVKALPLEFVVCGAVLILGVAYSVAMLPFVVPDEASHYKAAYELANIMLFRDPTPVMRADDLYFFDSLASKYASGAYYDLLKENCSLLAVDPSLVKTDSIGVYSFFGGWPPQVTFASASGIAIAQLLGLGTIPEIYLGRFLNLLYFDALLFFAVRVMPQGKRIIATVALLPMTLHVVSSLSYDAGILGMSFLLFALIMRAITAETDLRRRDLIGIMILSVLIAPCKVVYSLIILLALFIPNRKFKSTKQGVLFKVLVIVLPLTYVALTRLMTMTSIATIQASGGELACYTLSSIVDDPEWFLNFAVNTLFVRADFRAFTMLGYCLGPFQGNFYLPVAYFLPFLAILCLAALKSVDEDVLDTKLRAMLIFIFIAVDVLVTICMFLASTPVNAEMIEGVQGRYFLPVLPLLLLGLRGKSIVAQKDYTYALVYCEALASAFIVCINLSIAIL